MKKNVHEVIEKIEGKEWESALDKSFNKNVKNKKIDGFRDGKAPKDVYLKKYGVESLYDDALSYVLDKRYIEVLEKNKLEPVIQPSVEITDLNEKCCEVKFVITTKPEVKIGKYKGLKVEKDKLEITKEEISKAIDNLREKYVEIVVKEGKIKKGDIAILDFTGLKDGKEFDGGKAENYSLEVGSNTFIPGFEDGIIGMEKGQEKDLELTFPENYQAVDLKGQPVIFKVKINEIKEKVYPKIDKDFFEDLGLEDVNTKEKLEEFVKTQIRTQKEVEIENKYIEDVLAEIAKGVKVEILAEMIEDETNRMLNQYEEHLKMQGLDLETYLKFVNNTVDSLKNEMKPEAENRIKYRLMLEEISLLEDVKVTETEVDEATEKMAETYKIEKEEFLKMFGGKEMVEFDLKMKKTLDFLKENNSK